MIEITPKRLYQIGFYCFIIAGLANSWSFVGNFAYTSLATKVAALAGIVFNFALAGLFSYMLSMETQIENVAQSDDIDEIIREVSKNVKKRQRS